MQRGEPARAIEAMNRADDQERDDGAHVDAGVSRADRNLHAAAEERPLGQLVTQAVAHPLQEVLEHASSLALETSTAGRESTARR